MAKRKHMTGKPFSVEVCDAIRFHIGEGKSLESKRKNAFEDRNAALEEKIGLEDPDSPEYLAACKRHSDAVALIDSLDAQIKWHKNQVTELVEEADNPQLALEFDPPAPKPKSDPKQLKLEEAKDTRPVGRKPAAPEAPVAEGVDQHLAASVNELDLREDLKGKLIAAGFETIAQLCVVVDSDQDLAEKVDVTPAAAKSIEKSLKAYRKAHRSADAEARGVGR